MRPIRFLIDLPWWAGLLIFLAGNRLVSTWYATGLAVCLFGAWTYSKLLPARKEPAIGFALVGFPLFFLVMLIPDSVRFELPVLELLNGLSARALYGIRASLGIGVGFFAFMGARP